MRAAELVAFDWEVGLFRAVRGLWRRFTPDRPDPEPLEPQRVRLGSLASLVAGEPLRVLPSSGAGGVRGQELLLPARVVGLPAGPVRRLRVVHAATVRRLGLDRRPIPEDPVDRARLEVEVALEAARVAAEDFPGFGPAWAELCRACLALRPEPETLAGVPRAVETLRQAALRGERAGVRADGRSRGVSPPVPLWGEPIPPPSGAGGEASDLRPSRPRRDEAAPAIADALRRVAVSKQAQDEAVLQHCFEKVETIERFNGVVKRMDGTDELDAELEALREVDLGELVRDGTETEAALRADLGEAWVPDVEHIAPTERGIPYDEWDGRAYRRGWCTVYPTRFQGGDPAWTAAALRRHRLTIRRLRESLARHRDRLQTAPRQLDGEEVDVDALVDTWAECRSGRAGSPRVYLRFPRARRDLAVMLLLDVSLSSDAWVEDRRVLDVTREAALVLGEVTDGFGDALSIAGFASSTRNRCRVWTIKDWDDPWATARHRLGALCPQGYTRIGAAVRHATACLRSHPARRRLLVVLTDGRPTDYDRYEGRYGVGDVRMALREAGQRGVAVHALAVDRSARDTLPAMFGPGAWELLADPAGLPDALARIHARWGTR